MAAAFVGLLLAACAPAPATVDNASALADIATGRNAEVVVEGHVVRVLRTSRGPHGNHERFVLRIAAGGHSADVLVADNISLARAAPIYRGEDVVVKGALVLDPQGPVIHWTHHDPRGRHEGGFIEAGGHRYE